MNREQALKIVKEQITEHRYNHTLGVMHTAIELAEKYGADPQKAELAAIFHDYAKFRPKEEMAAIIEREGMDPRLLSAHSELWHAPVGAYLVQTEVGIDDPEVLDAIRYHTSGRVGMTLLDKVVYLADYIEPGRHFPKVEKVRKLAKEDLDEAVIKAVKNTIKFLMKRNKPIFPDTFDTYNDLTKKQKEEKR
ncbi:bis(5'-nucleosyl)-tetraphosphatase (symmetrical) YqeK [Bacillus sp. FJAT-42315]|uniref:bis(5'-nucleosyl)-tetraphosphatase (symmetrical) YqeK n=1 Tax=Bacillus sp. FJAT-42315 TaxID=2014077 RepID=UPI000C23C988|nr:bis(5'-nucleosyl)-tetraphosphatase (symmetrical) YqeK [Bacillus sp. FJAT-42315]